LGLLVAQGTSALRLAVVVAIAERWVVDLSEDIAQELRRRCDLEGRELPESIRDFVERYAGNPCQLTLRLVRSG
jgi:hypothetical protein